MLLPAYPVLTGCMIYEMNLNTQDKNEEYGPQVSFIILLYARISLCSSVNAQKQSLLVLSVCLYQLALIGMQKSEIVDHAENWGVVRS